MNFISIDAVTEKPNISLFINNKCIAEYNDCKNSSHLPRGIESCLEQSKISLKKLDYIAVTIGPGSYTGVRVGLSISQGIAYSLSIPIVPINTMDYLYSRARLIGDEDKIVGFPSYGNNIIYLEIKEGIQLANKIKDINYLKNKKIFGTQLNRFEGIIDYNEIEFSSKLIGLYSMENYSRLVTKDIATVAPIYLDIYGAKISD